MPALTAPPIVDRTLLDSRRRRAAARAPAGALFLLERVAEELDDRLSLVDRHFGVAVDLAGHAGLMAARIRASGKATYVVSVERSLELLGGGPALVGDEETLPFAAESVDLVVSPLSLHLTNDTPGVLVQVARALRPDGLLLAAFLGGDTLVELRAALIAAETELLGGVSPRVLPFADIRDAGALLQRAGLALPVSDVDRLTVRYASMFELMADLRAMGMANMLHQRSRRPGSRRLFLRAAQIYAERYSDPDGRVRATFDVIYLSGWKPHESQQKPLRPGSAKARLADALKPPSPPE